MPLLIFILRVFTATFGASYPKPEEERKYALFLAALLLLATVFMAAVLFVIFQFTR